MRVIVAAHWRGTRYHRASWGIAVDAASLPQRRPKIYRADRQADAKRYSSDTDR